MQGLVTENGSGAVAPPDLTVALPTARDALVNLSLPDGTGGVKHFKTHLDRLTRHSGFFAAASRQGTELKVREGAYSLDCNCRGFDQLLEYMRKSKLPSDLTIEQLASLHQLGSALDMSEGFWQALALHPAARGNGGICNGTACKKDSHGGGGGHCNGGGSTKGILKHASGGSGNKRTCAAAELASPAPASIKPYAKAYRKVLVDDMTDSVNGEKPFFNGEWYGGPAEMRVVATYNAEAPAERAASKRSESSHADAKHRPGAPAEPASDKGGGGANCGMRRSTPAAAAGSASATAAEAEAAAAADALLGSQPLVHVRRYALLEFTFEPHSS